MPEVINIQEVPVESHECAYDFGSDWDPMTKAHDMAEPKEEKSKESNDSY